MTNRLRPHAAPRAPRPGQAIRPVQRAARVTGRAGRWLLLAALLAAMAGPLGLATPGSAAALAALAAQAALPGVGDPVSFPAGESGESTGEGIAAGGAITVAVTQVVDPFGAFGTGTPPEGSRFVYVGLRVGNTTDLPWVVDPAALSVVDADGYRHRPSDRFGAAVLGGSGADEDDNAAPEGDEVAPGAEITGGAVFALPEAAALAAVYYDPSPDRLILLAVLTAPGQNAGGGQSDTAGEDGADGADGADGSNGADGQDGQGGQDGGDGGDGGDALGGDPFGDVPTEEGTEDDGDGDGGDATSGSGSGAGAGSAAVAITVPDEVDCDAFTPYYDELNGRLNALNDTVGSINDLVTTAMTDPFGTGEAITAVAADVATLAEEQADADVPPGLESLNDAAVAMFAAFAAALENLSTGLASFDMTVIQSVNGEIESAGAQNEAVVTAVNTLAEGCGLEI